MTKSSWLKGTYEFKWPNRRYDRKNKKCFSEKSQKSCTAIF
jgi:hypothetical protein